jgi:hypothetical protein
MDCQTSRLLYLKENVETNSTFRDEWLGSAKKYSFQDPESVLARQKMKYATSRLGNGNFPRRRIRTNTCINYASSYIN